MMLFPREGTRIARIANPPAAPANSRSNPYFFLPPLPIHIPEGYELAIGELAGA